MTAEKNTIPLVERIDATLHQFESRMYCFDSHNTPKQVKYHSNCSPCFLGLEHTILRHFCCLMSFDVYHDLNIPAWVITGSIDPEIVEPYKIAEEAWWNAHVPALYAWKPKYSHKYMY